MNAMPALVAATIGMLSGAHASIWGMYKDAAHEGFFWTRFSRSIFIGAACGAVIQMTLALPTSDAASLFLLFGLAYAAERGVVETWKTFVRNEDQSKYFIPMQFTVRGRPVESRVVRLVAGIGYVIAVGVCLMAIARLDGGGGARVSTMALVGLVTGLIIAIGGGWKDAPKEGFDPIKFMRSPAMTVFYTILLSRVTDSYLLAAVGSIGFERATAETYKTFFFPDTPRGKFAGMPVHFPEMHRHRRFAVPAFIAIWAVVVWLGAMALGSPTALLFASEGR